MLLVARLGAEHGDLGERCLAVLGPGLGTGALRLLVEVEGVRPEQGALRDRAGVRGVGDRQGEGGLPGPGEGTGGDAGGLAQRLTVVGAVPGAVGRGAQAHRHHERGLEAGGGGELRHLALGTGGTEGLQDAGELAVVRLVHGLGARCHDRSLGALGDTDHDRVGPQAGRRGGAESESSHGGEISLPM